MSVMVLICFCLLRICGRCVWPQKESQQCLKSLQLCRLLEGSSIHALPSLDHLVSVHFLLLWTSLTPCHFLHSPETNLNMEKGEKWWFKMFQKQCQNIPQSSNESYQKRCIAFLSWVGASERNYPTVVLCCEQQWICCLHWIFLLWWTLFQKLSKPSMFSSNPGFTIMPPPYSALSASAMHCLFSNQ